MPLFLSDEEFRLCSHDASAVSESADAFIRDLLRQLDTVRAEADAASIAAEQTCSLLEQRFESLSNDLDRIRSENAQLSSASEQRLSDLASALAEKHQLNLKAIAKDREVERLSLEAAEMQKSKRQLLVLVEQKDVEIREKNATIQSYLDKIVKLTDDATSKEARLHELDSELARRHATCNRVTQEKELLEKHNAWLNDELTSKVENLVELRRKDMNIEAEMSVKLAELERQVNESSNALKRSKERVRELESRVTSLEEDLCSSKDAAAATEEHFTAELSTVTKLAELYKTSSEEWSKKAGELDGVIKALETHYVQVINDYKEKLDKAMLDRRDCEKEIVDLKEKLEKCEADIENARKDNELSLVPISNFLADSNMEELSSGDTDIVDVHQKSHMLVPKVPMGISGTAVAASLLREGWSLAKMYEKYQEASDALRHEKWGRKHSEAVLERVLHEIEEKAEIILDERAEHERMVEAYTLLNQKLQQALSEHDSFESTIRRLKSELKRCEREHTFAQKEINDLQNQVTVLLKECQDVQLRCGAIPQIHADNTLSSSLADSGGVLDCESVISEHILPFTDINGLVEQNVKLRSLVRSLSSEEERRDSELTEGFQIELQRVTNEASSKLDAILERSDDQRRMIESLHSSVAMYKRLYEEERKTRASSRTNEEAVPENKRGDIMHLFDSSQEVSKKAHEQLSELAKNLEHDLERLRSELMSSRSVQDKLKLEANFAKERLDSFIKEYDQQRQEANSVSARNVELTHLLLDYQKRIRESSDSLQLAEENSRKLSMEVSILKYEKDILDGSEKRASAEVRSLSERVHRLQSTLDTIQTTEEVQENARAAERRKHEEYLNRVERDWAEAKKELQEERDRVRAITLDKEKAMEKSSNQVEEMRKELSDAWHAVASAESRAAVAEERCSSLEALNHSERKARKKDTGHDNSMIFTDEDAENLRKMREEMEKLKDEAHANKDYMLQYKDISQANETALNQIELAHKEYKEEAEKLKKALEDEISSLRNQVSELESKYILKTEEAASAIEAKEQALRCISTQTSVLKNEIADKMTQVKEMELVISSLRDDLDKEHKRWRTAQDNYERQVILQSETIQELTNTSKELALLQSENAKLRQLTETLKTENDILKSSWEKEKAQRQQIKVDAEIKYNDINEQNKILHNQLESLHIRLAAKEKNSAGSSIQNIDSQAESELHNVMNYLRRSREIAETEISLLKQEKLRIQSQLEVALKASETAQALLHSQFDNSRAMLFNDEEFKSLQFQVREINLLRESNIQLREENKHNFEECQKFREESQRAKLEAENIANSLREKQVEYDVCQKDIDIKNSEVEHLRNRISELLESSKHVDAEEYELLKNELQQNKVLLSEKEKEIQESKHQVSEKQGFILTLQSDLAQCQSELAEQVKKLNDAIHTEANIKAENEKQKRILSHLKKKNESLTKEMEEMNRENQSCLKQIQDLKSSTTSGESLIEQAKKLEEKDTKIQILEKHLDRLREENKKEKSRRKTTENTVKNLLQTVKVNKEKVEEEFAKHKHAILVVLESKYLGESQIPSSRTLDDQFFAYFRSVENIEVEATAAISLNDAQEPRSVPAGTSLMDTDTSAAGRQVALQGTPSAPQVAATDERLKGPTAIKPVTEVRKASRKLVRPHLGRSEEPTAEPEMPSAAEGPITGEAKVVTSIVPELSCDDSVPPHIPTSHARKRAAPSPALERRDGSVARDESNDDAKPPPKKTKESEFSPAGFEETSGSSPSENPIDTVPVPQPELEDLEGDQAPAPFANEEVMDMAKDEDDTTKEVEEDSLKASEDATNLDEIGDTIVLNELVSDQPSTSMELVDEGPISEEGKEIQEYIVEGDDDKEEGELMQDDSEQQPEDGASGEGHRETLAGDETVTDGEPGEITEPFSPEIQNEKSEIADISGEVSEGSNNDHGALVTAQHPQTSSRWREGSPNNLASTSASEQTPNATLDKAESRGGRTIDLTPKPKPSQARQRMAVQPPQRALGRAYAFRRELGRGSRGGRSGRGQE